MLRYYLSSHLGVRLMILGEISKEYWGVARVSDPLQGLTAVPRKYVVIHLAWQSNLRPDQ